MTLTHYYAKQSKAYKDYANQPNEYFLNVDLLKRFLETLEPMGNKLGPVIFQFKIFCIVLHYFLSHFTYLFNNILIFLCPQFKFFFYVQKFNILNQYLMFNFMQGCFLNRLELILGHF